MSRSTALTPRPRRSRTARAWVALASAVAVALACGSPAAGTAATMAPLAVGGSISGTVAIVGGPVPDLPVTAYDRTTGVGTTGHTDIDGHYVLPDLPAGQYTVKFDGRSRGLVSEHYDDQLDWADADPVTVTLGADTGGIDAVLVAGGTISGTVTGPNGPVANVWVGAMSDTYHDGTLTAADGTYELAGLQAGSYTVRFDASIAAENLVSEYWEDVVHWDDVSVVTVAANATTSGIDAVLAAGGSIAGVVNGPTGPVEGVSVRASDAVGGGYGYGFTAADGTYVVDGLPAGSYEVYFGAPDASGLRSEYYDNQVTELTADRVQLAAQQERAGIDAVLADEDDPLFFDVPTGHPFYDEIEWLAVRGVTTGFPDGGFHPSAPVERQAMAAFLYRFVGQPPFTPPATPSFIDVPAGSPFYTEIEWLADLGITTGWPDGTFRPMATVERQAMAAFLYRYAGEPGFTSPATATFSDVPPSATFFHEVEWLADTGITTGWPDGTFRPAAQVERQAMAAFLMRFDTWLWG